MGALLSPAAGVAASPVDGLLNNSPFGAAPKGGQSADVGNQPLEFRAVLEENGQKLFSIYDTATKHSRWLTQNDASGDVVIKSYDEDAHTISLERNGQSLSLTLKSGPRIAQSVQPPMQPGMQPGAVGLPGQSAQQIMAAKGPEAQRMQQIAEEIRRRRALRQQGPQGPMPAANGPGNGGPTPMPALPGMSGNSGPMPMPGAIPGPMPTPLPGATSSGPMPTPTKQ